MDSRVKTQLVRTTSAREALKDCALRFGRGECQEGQLCNAAIDYSSELLKLDKLAHLQKVEARNPRKK